MFKPKAVRLDYSNIQWSCTTFPVMINAYPYCVQVSKYGVFSGPYDLVFSRNTGKYGPEKTPPYLETFHAVR